MRKRPMRGALPLAGLRVVDLSRILAGPFCTMRLGDLGAEVVKIEQPGSGDETRRWGPPFVRGESAYYLSVNRNKKSVAVDLKSREGRAILRKLVLGADVLVENFRSGVMKRLGFDYAALRRINPRLIYCSITGYGTRSAKSGRPSYDLLIQGESGLMDLTGLPDGPPTKVGLSLCDISAGMLAVAAITASLYRRERAGKGERIDISLLESTVSLLTFQAQIALLSGQMVSRLGNLHPTLAPYQTFRTKDGYLNVAVVSDQVWKRFCRAIGRPALADHPRFSDNARRVKNRRALDAVIEPILRKKSSSSWERAFSQAEVPSGRIRSVREALRAESAMVETVAHDVCGALPMVRFPHLFQSSRPARTAPPPVLGEHTAHILRRLGYTAKEITRLRARSVI